MKHSIGTADNLRAHLAMGIVIHHSFALRLDILRATQSVPVPEALPAQRMKGLAMLRRSILALAMLAVVPAAAIAGPFNSFGPHLGFSSGPDQFVAGGHLQWSNVAPHLDFVPGIDFGFGSNTTLVSFNGDFRYRLQTNTTWRPYMGGGVGIHFASYDNAGPSLDSSDTYTGGHFIVGADVPTKARDRFFVEMKLGFSDSPDFRALAGWSFRAN